MYDSKVFPTKIGLKQLQQLNIIFKPIAKDINIFKINKFLPLTTLPRVLE